MKSRLAVVAAAAVTAGLLATAPTSSAAITSCTVDTSKVRADIPVLLADVSTWLADHKTVITLTVANATAPTPTTLALLTAGQANVAADLVKFTADLTQLKTDAAAVKAVCV